MEHLWSPAGATSGNRWQMGSPRKRLKQADRQPVATHGNRFGAHGKGRPSLLRNAMKKGLPTGRLRFVQWELLRGGPSPMLHAGLDLSRKRLDFCLLDE